MAHNHERAGAVSAPAIFNPLIQKRFIVDNSMFSFEEFCQDVVEFVTTECAWNYEEAQNYAHSLLDYYQDGWSAKEAVLHDFANNVEDTIYYDDEEYDRNTIDY